MTKDNETENKGFMAVVQKDQQKPVIRFKRRIRKDRETKSSQTDDEITPPVETSEILTIAHSNAWHGRCVEIKTKNVIKDFDIDDRERAVLEEWISDDFDTIYEALLQYEIDFQNTGNTYLEMNRMGRKLTRIYRVEPETMTIKKDGSFIQRTDDDLELPKYDSDEIDSNSIFHIRNVNSLSSFYGYPTWIFALESLRLDRNIKTFFSSFFKNGAVPDIIIALEGADFSKPVKEKIKLALSQTKGVENMHKTLLLGLPYENAKLNVTTLTSPIKDIDFEKIGKPSREEIIAAHGVPPRLLGIIPGGQLGGQGDGDSQLETFYNTVIEPEQNFLAAKINKILQDQGYKGTLEFNHPYKDKKSSVTKSKKGISWR